MYMHVEWLCKSMCHASCQIRPHMEIRLGLCVPDCQKGHFDKFKYEAIGMTSQDQYRTFCRQHSLLRSSGKC